MLWLEIIRQKIKGQKEVLKKYNKDTQSIILLEQYLKDIHPYDSTNREGLAAKVYFHSLFGINFSRMDENAINACLNYGYSIIRAYICRTIVAKGLNTQLGIFHRGPQNAFNLADDIIEPFRPIVDNFVYQNFINLKIFTKEERLKLLELLNLKIEVNNEKITLTHSIDKFVDSLIQYLNSQGKNNIIQISPLYDDL